MHVVMQAAQGGLTTLDRAHAELVRDGEARMRKALQGA
jgi:hypothetical protein